MSTCPICQHAKRGAIDAALTTALPLSVIAGRFHVPMKLLGLHREHVQAREPVIGGTGPTTRADEAPMASCPVCAQRPLMRLRQVWQDAKDDRQEQLRMIAWLNEVLQTDEMGL